MKEKHSASVQRILGDRNKNDYMRVAIAQSWYRKKVCVQMTKMKAHPRGIYKERHS